MKRFLLPESTYWHKENDVSLGFSGGNLGRAEFGFWPADFPVTRVAFHAHGLLILRNPNHPSHGFTFGTLHFVTNFN